MFWIYTLSIHPQSDMITNVIRDLSVHFFTLKINAVSLNYNKYSFDIMQHVF